MLTHLHISNFAIVRALEIEWHPGMTTITGETGAGKSISLDALALCLGERADGTVVRPGTDKADFVATFDISNLPAAQQWLQSHAGLQTQPHSGGKGTGQPPQNPRHHQPDIATSHTAGRKK